MTDSGGRDRALRRWAWAAALFSVGMIALRLVLFLLDGSNSAADTSAASVVSDSLLAMVIVAFALVALLILRRQPRNTVGWMLMAVGLAWGFGEATDVYARVGLLTHPGSLPGAEIAAALHQGVWAPAIGVMGTFLLLLYPDGHLASRRWRPVAWISGVTITVLFVVFTIFPGRLQEGPVQTLENPLGWTAGEPILDALIVVFVPMFLLSIGASAVGLVRRLRRSAGVERLQLKWLTTAGAFVAAIFLASVLADVLFLEQPAWLGLLDTLALISCLLIPAAIGTAILKHRLYEIDVIINRALVYALLSATLAATYLGSVLMLQVALRPVTERSDLAVAGSTLAVAALFGPIRVRIQRGVDRRFYRSRYDASRALEDFSQRLRHELDLDAVGADLRTVLDGALHPAHMSLWLRP